MFVGELVYRSVHVVAIAIPYRQDGMSQPGAAETPP